MPRILTRKDWGAQPAKRFSGYMVEPVPEVYIHHTVTPTFESDPAWGMREIQKIAFARGFYDISYSWAFFLNGLIAEGRGWGVVGAHTEGRNSRALGFVLVGNYEEIEPPQIQIDSIMYMLDLGQSLGKIKKDTVPEVPTGGHRDLKSTACPGIKAYRMIPDMRRPYSPVVEEEDMPPKPVKCADHLSESKQWLISGGFRKGFGSELELRRHADAGLVAKKADGSPADPERWPHNEIVAYPEVGS